MDSLSLDAGSHRPTKLQRAESVCIGIGKATVIGALIYGGLYATGRCRHLAGRVVKYSIAGSLVGLVGLILGRINRLSPLDRVLALASSIPSGPSPKELEGSASVAALQEVLGEEVSEHQTIYDIAEKLETTSAPSDQKLNVLKRYFRSHQLRIERNVRGFGERMLPATFIAFYGAQLISEDKQPSALATNALISILQEESAQCQPSADSVAADEQQPPVGIVLEVFHDLDPVREVLSLLDQVDNLIAITCAHQGGDETFEVLKELVEKCPKLVEVPHVGRRMANHFIKSDDAKLRAIAQSEFAFCDLLEQKCVREIPQL